MLDIQKKLHNYQKIIRFNWKNQKMNKKKDQKKSKMRDKYQKMKKKSFKEILVK